MNMKRKVIIWTQEDCRFCQEIKAVFAEEGYEERAAKELINGQDRDVEAMAQLAMQNMQLPLVMVSGEFVSPQEILNHKSNAA